MSQITSMLAVIWRDKVAVDDFEDFTTAIQNDPFYLLSYMKDL